MLENLILNSANQWKEKDSDVDSSIYYRWWGAGDVGISLGNVDGFLPPLIRMVFRLFNKAKKQDLFWVLDFILAGESIKWSVEITLV